MIEITPLLPGEFSAWCDEHKRKYALERAQYGGGTLEEQAQVVEKQMQTTLPQGIATPHHYFFWIKEQGNRVGEVWFEHRVTEGLVYLYFIEIFSRFRGRGLSKLALQLVEARARGLGAKKIQLHVFAANAVARTLYMKQDFRETSVWMEKDLKDID